MSSDGDTVSISLPALQQQAARLDALGVTFEGRKASEALAAATKVDLAAAAALLDDVSQCVLGYGN